MTATDTFPCYMVRKDANGKIEAKVERISKDNLPPGEVVIRVEYSSLNYKDALAWQGHPGVVRSLPHVPGIDCAGTVEESSRPTFVRAMKCSLLDTILGWELGRLFAICTRAGGLDCGDAERPHHARGDDLWHRRFYGGVMRDGDCRPWYYARARIDRRYWCDGWRRFAVGGDSGKARVRRRSGDGQGRASRLAEADRREDNSRS